MRNNCTSHMLMPRRRLQNRALPTVLAVLVFVASIVSLPHRAPAAERQLRGVETGLPLPRFVSLKSGTVNVRRGPSKMHQVDWVYKRRHLPVEIVSEFEHWRRIRDYEGDVGWVHKSLLAGDRTALIRGAVGGDPVSLFALPDDASVVTAFVEPGVIAFLNKCDLEWCLIAVSNADHSAEGWVTRARLWGIYTNERIGD